MLFWLTELSDGGDFFNLFRYITLRAGGAFFTALVFGFVFGKPLINLLRRRQKFGQPIRDDGPESHLVTKQGTPTMGGLLILSALISSTLLWARLDNGFVWILLFVTTSFGLIGFLDDYLKVVQGKTRGLVARYKMIGQWTFGLALGAFLIWNPISEHPTTWTSVPFFANVAAVFPVPVFVIFTGIVVSGSSNAVNLTDGLDGLAAGLTAIAAATLGIFAYIAGRVDTSHYLGFFYLPGAGELTIFALALAGGRAAEEEACIVVSPPAHPRKRQLGRHLSSSSSSSSSHSPPRSLLHSGSVQGAELGQQVRRIRATISRRGEG